MRELLRLANLKTVGGVGEGGDTELMRQCAGSNPEAHFLLRKLW